MGWDDSACKPLGTPTGSDGNAYGKLNQVPCNQRAGDRERLKRSFLTILTEHPVLMLLVVLLFGALVFSHVLP
jgi:hypothetical protein